VTVCGTKTLFPCVCTQHRNRIGRLSPFSEYAPTASRFKPNSFATIKLVQSPMDARKPPVRLELIALRLSRELSCALPPYQVDARCTSSNANQSRKS